MHIIYVYIYSYVYVGLMTLTYLSELVAPGSRMSDDPHQREAGQDALAHDHLRFLAMQ